MAFRFIPLFIFFVKVFIFFINYVLRVLIEIQIKFLVKQLKKKQPYSRVKHGTPF